MSRRAAIRSGLKRISNWLGHRDRSPRPSPSAKLAPASGVSYHGWAGESCAGGKLADITDLLDPAFGATFRDRLHDRGDMRHPRKLWELAWLAQRFEDLKLAGGDMLGLGVGQEPLIYHFAHHARSVIATDLYSAGTAWREARLAVDQVLDASPFPYPRERLSVKNMDMRKLDAPDDSVDVVWSCSSVEHVQTLPQFTQIFREIHRVLRPGGVALITTEFSVGDPYFLPGVLSLWPGCRLFERDFQGLTLIGRVDTRYRCDVPGNLPTPRRDVVRSALLSDFAGGPTGLCIHIGYTQSIPIAMAFRKTGPTFDWSEHLGAPDWYAPLATGIEIFSDKKRAAEAGVHFRRALEAADTPGARLHCFRSLIESQVHAGQVAELNETLLACQAVSLDFPADDDALDLIGLVAGGAGHLPFARRCWEKAAFSPSALPASKFRIRLNQLDAEYRGGPEGETRRLYHLAEAARWEALDFLGSKDILFVQLDEQFKGLRERIGIVAPTTAPTPPVAAPTPAPIPIGVPNGPIVNIRWPEINVMAPPVRPLVCVAENLALTKTAYGHKMFVDSRTQVGACFLLDGFWEEWIVRHLKDLVKPGMRVLDVGANMGFYTLLFADLVGPAGSVVAFEATDHMADLLSRNVELNGYQTRTTVVRKVVHAAKGIYRFANYDRYGTGAVVNATEAEFQASAAEVQRKRAPGSAETPTFSELAGISLDEYCADDTKPVDLIKLDVDGSEPHVFRGMRGLLEQRRALTILCEFTPPMYAKSGMDPLEFLEDIVGAGFRISEFATEGIKPIETLPELARTRWAELLLVRDAA